MLSVLFLKLFVLNLLNLIDSNCDSEIHCRGPILEKIQMSGLFADSKQFVDMPTSKSKAVVITSKIIFNFISLGIKKLCSFT